MLILVTHDALPPPLQPRPSLGIAALSENKEPRKGEETTERRAMFGRESSEPETRGFWIGPAADKEEEEWG